MATDQTHDPKLRSWVESANDPASDFPIQNLPLCAFMAEHDGHRHGHLGVVIGDQVLDVSFLAEAGLFRSDQDETLGLLRYPFWDAVASRPNGVRSVRAALQSFLKADSPAGQQARRLRGKALRPVAETAFTLPARCLNYTDFYASVHHASTVGAMFRPDQPLLPNYKHVPIGYHGRASSIVLSGSEIRRPNGQQAPPEGETGGGPSFGPCKMLDFELEVGCFIGPGNALGEPIPINDTERHILGLVLLNDWSARDIQKWEYQPLGPFLAKNFATSISPFIVTVEALAPFRAPGFSRGSGDPSPLPYLYSEADKTSGGFEITLEVSLQSKKMRESGAAPVRISSGRFNDMFWSFGQMIAHHTSNGCNLQTGDLLGSGTISGSTSESRGCLLELTWQGTDPATGKPKPRKPIELPGPGGGETRTFLADGDTVIFKGFCEREGFRRIGFGECRGTISPAPAL